MTDKGENRKKDRKYWVHTMLQLEDNNRPECVILKGEKRKEIVRKHQL